MAGFSFESDPSQGDVFAPIQTPTDYILPDNLEDSNHFDFLMQNEDNDSDASSTSDVLSDPNFDFTGAAIEDNSFGLLPEAMLETESPDLTSESDLISLVSSIDIQQMDQAALDSFQKSLEELGVTFEDTTMVDPAN